MRRELVEVMQDQVRTIYHALTGDPIPAPPADTGEEQAPTEDIALRFAALQALVRGRPRVAARVPPFSFTPALDATEGPDEVLLELAVPGVDRDDVAVEVHEYTLVVAGLRRGRPCPDGMMFTRAELPRGPFQRTYRLPFPAIDPPDVELDRGLLRIRLRRATEPPAGHDGH